MWPLQRPNTLGALHPLGAAALLVLLSFSRLETRTTTGRRFMTWNPIWKSKA